MGAAGLSAGASTTLFSATAAATGVAGVAGTGAAAQGDGAQDIGLGLLCVDEVIVTKRYLGFNQTKKPIIRVVAADFRLLEVRCQN